MKQYAVSNVWTKPIEGGWGGYALAMSSSRRGESSMNPNTLKSYIGSVKRSLAIDLFLMVVVISYIYRGTALDDWTMDLNILSLMIWVGLFVYDLGDALRAFIWWNELAD